MLPYTPLGVKDDDDDDDDFGKFHLDESFCVVSRVKLSNADEKFEREVREEAEGHAPFSTSAMVIT